MLKKYESIPNQHKMITNKMTLWILLDVGALCHAHVAIFDLIILGRYAGCCASEWSQTTKYDYAWILALPTQPPIAFSVTDLEFLDKRESLLINTSLCPPHLVSCVCNLWRTQKKKQNWE